MQIAVIITHSDINEFLSRAGLDKKARKDDLILTVTLK